MSHPMSVSDKELRKFGFVFSLFVAGVFGFLGPMLRKHSIPTWPWIVATIVITPAIFYPSLLATFHRLWTALGDVLGYINSRIILGVIYFVIVFPISLLARAFGKEFIPLHFDKSLKTYRKSREDHFSTERMSKPF